ncbi:MAG TPA: prepilin-type N-terminal cleavage/methylation domain-containing protein [Chthoniobacterales bacterium]
MTISGTGKRAVERGFTLLEVALALFIVLLVLAVALPFAGGLNREAALRAPADELKTLAVTARRLAITNRKTYELILDRNRYILRALPIDSKDEEKDRNERPVSESEILRRYDVPRDVAYGVKHWDENDFSKETDSRWRFLPTGICEPITVRFARNTDWLLFSFNPLTANAEDEAFYFP